MRKEAKGHGYSLYEKVVLSALLFFFLSMLFMFFVLPRI
jgi:hypothetical protein